MLMQLVSWASGASFFFSARPARVRYTQVESVTYLTGGEEEPGRSEKIKLDLPPTIKVKRSGRWGNV